MATLRCFSAEKRRRQERFMTEHIETLPQDAVAYLRMADGECRFPIRPVHEGDFLIGSGMDCDLRLGDGILPPLHSVLRVTSKAAIWTRLVRLPALVVNGETVQQAELNDGDLVEIGPFRLTFRFASERAEAALQDLLTADRRSIGANFPSGLSASDLTDLLHREMVTVETLQRNTADAISEMFRIFGQPDSETNAQTRSTAEPPKESAHDGEELLRIIHSQADRIESLSEVLDHVVRQQRIMTDVLHGLTERIAAMQSNPGSIRRASA